jgi:uncharacterized protein
VSQSFLTPLLKNADGGWLLVSAATGAVIARHVETAFDSERRNRGLLGRSSFPPGSAMVLAPCSAIHTFFMPFAIDVAFTDRAGAIVRTVVNLRPWRIAIAFRAFATIELPAGTLIASGVERGDALRFVRG